MAWLLRRQDERETQGGESSLSVPTPGLDREAVLAEALSEARLLVYVARASATSWRAAAWLLEHRYPERYGHGSAPETPVPDRAIVRHLMSLPPPSDPA